MFEEYGFDGVYVAIQAVLTLYAQGEFVRRMAEACWEGKIRGIDSFVDWQKVGQKIFSMNRDKSRITFSFSDDLNS